MRHIAGALQATAGEAPAAPRLRKSGAVLWEGYGPFAGSGLKLVSRPIEQANLVLGCEGLARTDERRFALGVLNAALYATLRILISRRLKKAD